MKKKGIIILVMLFITWLGNILYNKYTKKIIIVTAPILQDNEKEKIIVDSKKKTTTIVTRDGGKQVIKGKEGGRTTVVTVDKDGTVSVSSPQLGFIFEPGVVVGFTDRLNAGVDAQVVYCKRWGINVGVITDREYHLKLTLSGSYLLPFGMFSNTSLLVGATNKQDLFVGIRVGF